MAEQSPTVRLFVECGLTVGEPVALDPDQIHYLHRVMRLGVGAHLKLFNGRDGEWRAAIDTIDKRNAILRPVELIRPQSAEPDVWLAFAPIKKARTDYIVEKAVELGARRLIPVITEFSATRRVNSARLGATAREAAEQCGRLTLPVVAPACPLDRLLADWPCERRLYLLDETRTGVAPDEAFSAAHGCVGFVTGPEGGFSKRELDLMRDLAFVTAISLGPRILRAETAAAAVLACYQAIAGDWR